MADEPIPPKDMEEILATFHDLFGDFFGARKLTGGDRRVSLGLSAVEEAAGTKKHVRYTRIRPCPQCVDHGVCDACRGEGQVALRQGDLTVTKPCAGCAGRGRFVEACGGCTGGGVEGRDSVSVEVPAGLAGKTLRLPGQGDAPVGLTPGDLYVDIHIEGPSADGSDGVRRAAHPFRGAAPGAPPSPAIADPPSRRSGALAVLAAVVALLGLAWAFAR